MFKILDFISKRLVIAIPLSLLSGFLYGIFFEPSRLKGFILPLTFVMVYPMLVNLNWGKLLKGGDAKLIVVGQAFNFIVVPFFAYFLSILFFKDHPFLLLGLFLSSLFPTSGMTITWTGFSRGNVEAAVKMTLLGLTLGSLLSPFYLKFALGKVIPVSILEIFKQILIIIVIPLILGALTKVLLLRFLGQETFQKKVAPKFPSVSSLGVLGLVFVAISLKSKAIISSPQILLFSLFPVIILYALNIGSITFVARKFFNYEDGTALVFATVARNLSIALALAVNAFGQKGTEAALVLAAAFIIQSQAMAWYSKLTPKLLGKKEVPPELKEEFVRA